MINIFSLFVIRKMYRLRCSKFRHYETLDKSFPEKGLILLDGKSGIGKTNLFEAMSFVLYDEAGNSCYPRQDKNEKKKPETTWVELTFPNGLIIYRQRRSNMLRVVGPNLDLTDDAAQGYIDRIFGPINTWLVGGYLRQGELCALFTMSSDEKLNLLRQISPDIESIEIELNNTIENIKVLSKNYQESEMNLKVYYEMYMNIYNQCNDEVKNTKIWSSNKISKLLEKYKCNNLQEIISKVRYEYQTKHQTIQSNINNHKIQVARIKENLNQRNRITSSIKDHEMKLLNYKDDISDLITTHEKELNILAEQINLAQRTEKRSQLLASKTDNQQRLDLIPEESSKYTIAELDRYDKILSGPTFEYIEQQFKEIDLAQEYQNILVEYNKYQQVLTQLNNFNKQLETYPKSSVVNEIEDINKKIWALKLKQEKLTCPSCTKSLRLNNGKLELMEEEIREVVENISELNVQKNKYQQIETFFQQRHHIEKSRDIVQQQLDSLKVITSLPLKPKLADYQLSRMVTQLNDSKKARESLPVDINTNEERRKIINNQNRNNLINIIKNISNELSILNCDGSQAIETKDLIIKQNEIRNEIIKYRKQEMEKVSLNATHKQLISQLNNYPEEDFVNLEIKIKELEDELNLSIQKLDKSEKDVNIQVKLVQLSDYSLKYSDCQKIHQVISMELAAFQKIKASLITAEYVKLDTVLSTINNIIAEILCKLFDEQISVTIHTLKQLKTDDRIKPQINCKIIFNGCECSSIMGLSFGQRIRVSIALAIAFSQYGNSPFLILDESLSTLDVLTKESTIKLLKWYLPNKLIITVNHDTTVGIYNSVINI